MIKADGVGDGARRLGRLQAAELDDPADGHRGGRGRSWSCARSRATTGSRSGSPRCSPTSRTTWAADGDLGATLEKDGVEAHLQELLADAPHWCGEGFRLVRREWPTDIGPVDLMCRDDDDGWIAVEIKRVGTIDAVEQLDALPRADPARPGDGRLPRRARRAVDQAAGPRAGREPRASPGSRSTSPCCAASASPTSRCSRPERLRAAVGSPAMSETRPHPQS